MTADQTATTLRAEVDPRSLAVVLARVRCEEVHGQTNNGRCIHCILWAERIGVPRHIETLRTRPTPPTAADERGQR